MLGRLRCTLQKNLPYTIYKAKYNSYFFYILAIVKKILERIYIKTLSMIRILSQSMLKTFRHVYILSSDQFSLDKIFNWTIVCLERHNDETFHVS